MPTLNLHCQHKAVGSATRPQFELVTVALIDNSLMVKQNTMKVAIATAFPVDPARPRGGVEAVSVNLVRGLARFDDLDVHVITTDTECAAATETTWEGATLHRLPRRGRRVLSDATGPGRQTVSEFIERLRPDVVHAHDVYGLMVKGLAIPRVFTVHGFIHEDTRLAGERFAALRSRIWKRVEIAGWADQPHIISISPYVRERLAPLVPGVIHDIDNPIDAGCFDVTPNRTRKIVFSAALINHRKNTLGLIEAFGQYIANGGDAELRLAGPVAEEEYGRRVHAMIAKLGIGDRVRLLGSIPAAQVRQELAAASVFALVSFEEGAPMGVAEAMAAGVPVVTSNRCGMPYMVRHGETGFLVDPNDARDIARHLGELLNDRNRIDAMGAEARRVARERFHPDVVARRTREVYRRASGR